MGVVVFDIGLASFLIIFFVIYQKKKKKACNCKTEYEHQKEKGFLCLLTTWFSVRLFDCVKHLSSVWLGSVTSVGYKVFL